jgi:hypothetical protein
LPTRNLIINTSGDTVEYAIEIGANNIPLIFNNAVRIDLVGQTEKKAAWVQNGVWTPITTPLSGDTQAIGNDLPVDGDGYYDDGTDLIIWTKHFTTYVVYSEASVVSGGGGGGGVVATTSAPTIGSASETTGKVGDTVTITGSGFTGATAVDFGSASATFTVVSNTEIAATVPTGTGTVDITVVNPSGTSATSTQFIYEPVTVIIPTPAPVVAIFSDVPSTYWGYNAINSLGGKGIIKGYADNTFKPDAPVTRAEFATMLAKALGLNTIETTGTFKDVTSDTWCYGYVNAAASAGVVFGVGDNMFAPNALITREQMAQMMSKALGSKAPVADGTELNAFGDSSSISGWAVPGVEVVAKAHIISGMPDGTFAPQSKATRAQAAAVIYKLLTVLGK